MSFARDLIPNGKNEKWLIAFEGDVKEFFYAESKDEVFMEMVNLKESGFDMSKVFIFPPLSSLNFEDFFRHQ